jgi:hypothetical protein
LHRSGGKFAENLSDAIRRKQSIEIDGVAGCVAGRIHQFETMLTAVLETPRSPFAPNEVPTAPNRRMCAALAWRGRAALVFA